MNDKLIRAALELCESAEALKDSINQLWWAQNPDEREGTPHSEEHCLEVQSECFEHLARCVHEVRKRCSTAQREVK